MSLKGIELQIAIPKTFEAGRVAEQKLQKSQLSQDLANMQTDKQVQKNRESVLETEKYAELDSDRENEENEQQQSEKRKKEQKKSTNHPYKGSFVDYSG